MANEIHFYSDIVPAIEQFEQNSNVPEIERIDAFVRYFGARLSMNPGEFFFHEKKNAYKILAL